MIRHAEPSPVKLHEVETRNNRCGISSAPIDGVMNGCYYDTIKGDHIHTERRK